MASYDDLRAETNVALWPYSQVLVATLAVARISPAPVARALRALEPYWDGDGYDSTTSGGDKYYDDNEWVALALLDAGAYSRAQEVFAFVRSGWDDDASHPCRGGVFWTRNPSVDHRNAVSTANGARVALRLYLETRRPSYLAWGRRMYAWVQRCLGGVDGLFADHLDLRGQVQPTRWSYNQGAMIDAALLLYRATQDARYRRDALTLAERAADRFAAREADEPAEFLAILARSLLRVDAELGADRYRPLVEQWAQHAWERPRTTLLARAALVRLYADLATL